MGKGISQLEADVRWWQDEIRAREGKVKEPERTLEQRERELADAKRDEEQEKEKAKSSASKNRY